MLASFTRICRNDPVWVILMTFVQLWAKMAFNFMNVTPSPWILPSWVTLDCQSTQCHHQNGLCITMGSNVSSFNVPFMTVMDLKVTKPVSVNYNFLRERKAEAESNRDPSAYQLTSYYYANSTRSLESRYCYFIIRSETERCRLPGSALTKTARRA